MKRLELMITNGELAGKRFVVTETGLRLGRSSSNDIHVQDEQLSRNHCLFEIVGESGIRITDLASANGTLVNGQPLDAEPRELKLGDLIEVGTTEISVVGDQPTPVPPTSADAVDLGLGKAEDAPPPSKRRSPLVNVLWIVAVLAALGAIYMVLVVPSASDEATPVAVVEEKPVVEEIRYEKVEATLDSIFRYELLVDSAGMISVNLDDTKENRHLVIRPKRLGEGAVSELNDILAMKNVSEFEPEYVGAEPDPPALNSWRLKVVYTTGVKSVDVVNTQEPEAFRVLREKLEAFTKNELGIHAIQYPREKLIALAEEAIAIGKAKWEDREVQHGNLFGSAAAYREAIFYLDTLDPKPDCIHEARQGLEAAQAELDKRYKDQRFLADRAINLSQWDTAQSELTVLLEMIPDRNDDRNREAAAKLVDVEKRMKGGK